MLLTGSLCLLGCGQPDASPPPARTLRAEDVTTAQVLQAAEDVLTRMQFPIEKLDAEQGVVRTRPLRGGQFFELWRGDNASPSAWTEANLQSIRRSVEVRVKGEAAGRRPETGGADSLQPAASSPLWIECEVSVQRLSLPENEIAGVSQAYRIHTPSTPTIQRIAVTPQQQAAMAWIDLGPDRELAARILERIEQRLARPN
jgi:hypothetical protein